MAYYKTLIIVVCFTVACFLNIVDAQEKGATIGKSCKYLLTSKRYQFTSPGYPEYYPNNATCMWKIVAEEDYHILLTINDVDMEDSKHCHFDSVTVYDGEDDTAIPVRKICGKKLPERVQSISNILTIIMESDSSYTGKGFQMKYKTIPACTSVYTDSSGHTFSPGFPLGYPDGAYCTYQFYAKNGKYIHLYFEEFELEEMQYYECFDYINIITSVNGTEEELQGQFCGTSLSKVGICFRATKVTLRFVTDNAFNLRGFKMAFMVSDDKCSADEDIGKLKNLQAKGVLKDDIAQFNKLIDEELGGLDRNSSGVSQTSKLSTELEKFKMLVDERLKEKRKKEAKLEKTHPTTPMLSDSEHFAEFQKLVEEELKKKKKTTARPTILPTLPTHVTSDSDDFEEFKKLVEEDLKVKSKIPPTKPNIDFEDFKKFIGEEEDDEEEELEREKPSPTNLSIEDFIREVGIKEIPSGLHHNQQSSNHMQIKPSIQGKAVEKPVPPIEKKNIQSLKHIQQTTFSIQKVHKSPVLSVHHEHTRKLINTPQGKHTFATPVPRINIYLSPTTSTKKMTHKDQSMTDTIQAIPSSLQMWQTSTITTAGDVGSNNDTSTTDSSTKSSSKCSRYVSVEIKDGAMPLSNYESREKQQIQDLLDSNITTVWEVAWPYAGIMGREGLLHYGTLLVVNSKNYLLYILGRRVHLVELTAETMKQHQVEYSMKLNDNMQMPLYKHLKRIPSIIKMTVQVCDP